MAWMAEPDGEDVAVFRKVDFQGDMFVLGSRVVATQQSYEAGESFTRYGDVLEEQRDE
jgi:hypothetical protein